MSKKNDVLTKMLDYGILMVLIILILFFCCIQQFSQH